VLRASTPSFEVPSPPPRLSHSSLSFAAPPCQSHLPPPTSRAAPPSRSTSRDRAYTGWYSQPPSQSQALRGPIISDAPAAAALR
jgi:hypothetical protein